MVNLVSLLFSLAESQWLTTRGTTSRPKARLWVVLLFLSQVLQLKASYLHIWASALSHIHRAKTHQVLIHGASVSSASWVASSSLVDALQFGQHMEYSRYAVRWRISTSKSYCLSPMEAWSEELLLSGWFWKLKMTLRIHSKKEDVWLPLL